MFKLFYGWLEYTGFLQRKPSLISFIGSNVVVACGAGRFGYPAGLVEGINFLLLVVVLLWRSEAYGILLRQRENAPLPRSCAAWLSKDAVTHGCCSAKPYADAVSAT